MIRHSAPTLGVEEEAAAVRVMRSGRIAQGREVEAFERECADYVGRRHAVALSSGTAALHVTLDALGVLGERVGVPAYACAALPVAIRLAGGEPVLYEAGVGAAPRDCRAIVLAHLFGTYVMPPEDGVYVDDIAQCFGVPVSRGPIATVTSFYATKLMTTGEGGMVLTDEDGVAAFVRDRRDYDNRDDFARRYSYKMTDIQAAIGRVQLRRLPEFLARRRELAKRYGEGLRGLPMDLPSGEPHAWFRYVVGVSERAALQAHLGANGIEAKRPVHAPAHHHLGGCFPEADRAHDTYLSLPIYPTLVDSEADDVIRCVRRFFD